jgi:hypothetical protein
MAPTTRSWSRSRRRRRATSTCCAALARRGAPAADRLHAEVDAQAARRPRRPPPTSPRAPSDPSSATAGSTRTRLRRVLMCSGRITWDLMTERKKREGDEAHDAGGAGRAALPRPLERSGAELATIPEPRGGPVGAGRAREHGPVAALRAEPCAAARRAVPTGLAPRVGPPPRSAGVPARRGAEVRARARPSPEPAVYFTDRGVEELAARRGDEEVTLAWLAERLQEFATCTPSSRRRSSGSPPGWPRSTTLTTNEGASGATGLLRARRSGLRCLRPGSARRPPVVLLHGFPQRATSWNQVAPAAARGRDALARSRPAGLLARGASAWALVVPDEPAGGGRRRAGGDARPGRVHLVGHDWGAAVAGRWRRRGPTWWRR